MALLISQQNEVYYLKGKLNSTNSRSFIIHFEYLLSITDHVKINVDEVNEYDINGVMAFEILYAIALNNSKNLSVSSNFNNEIFSEISYINAA